MKLKLKTSLHPLECSSVSCSLSAADGQSVLIGCVFIYQPVLVSLTSDALFKNSRASHWLSYMALRRLSENANQVLAGQCTDSYMCVRSLGDFYD